MTSALVDSFLEVAVRGDGRAGVRLALDALDRGVPSDDVIVHLLGPAQVEVGDRWLRNEWGVAEEHLVSGVTQKALNAVANSVEPPEARGFVVVACAEGDWHSLPAQMFAELLRSQGFSVAFLGASIPVDQVAAFLARERPDALAVSCCLPLFFSGVARMADAARAQGIPALAGGRAFGRGQTRAIRLGVDRAVTSIDDAAAVLGTWRENRPRPLPGPTLLDPAALLLEVKADEVAAQAFESLSRSYPPTGSYSEPERQRAKEDLAQITRFLTAARLVDDLSVLTDYLDWLWAFLASRQVAADALKAGLTALVPFVRQIDPRAGAWLEEGHAALDFALPGG